VSDYRRGVPNVITRGLRRWQLIGIDAVIAVGLLLIAGVAASDTDTTASFTGPAEYGLLIAALLTLPIAVRRIWPLPVLAVVATMLAIASASGIAWGDSGGAFMVPLAFALYPVGLLEPRRTAVPALIVCLTGTAVATVLSSPGWLAVQLIIFTWLVLFMSWAAGRVMRARRAYAASTAEQLATQAVADERLRIARELHDIVAHSLSLISVKAAVANHVARERPEEAQDALRVIADTSRDTLTEMRRLLGVLRSDGTGPELAPSPGLAGLPELADRASLAGVRVDLDVRGGGSLPDGVELSVYRIVQEALTNVVKHAAPARCRVSVRADESEARIEVVDDGPGGRVLPGPAQGHGLIGMRERVMMYDGVFSAGPRTEGGFAVSARLPYSTEGA
jgi:signal transduction histidine kinase